APAVLVATIGPGVANCVNVVANAHQDRVPMIVLTGRVDAAEAETYTHQVFDHQALMRPITKGSYLASKGAVSTVISRALTEALAGQPGPVHIDLPIAVAESEEAIAFDSAPLVLGRVGPAQSGDLDRARAILSAARRPLVIAGVDAVNQNASPEIEAFCRRYSAPLITSYKGKGLIAEDDTLALSGAGLSPKADKILLPLMAQADAIILAGYDPIEMRINWRHPWPASTPVIEFTAARPTHYMYGASVTFVGDVAVGLQSLGEGAVPAQPSSVWPGGEPAAAKAALRTVFAPKSEWGPDVAFETIRALAPRDAIATADSGAHRILLSQIWRCFEPRSLLQSSGLCTMGCALPLALGYQMAAPDRPVFAFMGDAGIEMVMGELATARDLKVPVIIVVLVDHSLALIELKQRAMQKPQVGVRFGGTDFVAVAEACGGYGCLVDNRDALERETKLALARRDAFSLIAVRIADHAYEGLI
ncbi:MAG: thiamine pyrophosphate-binding protein, partial [Beijerinckiaceae bacterium]|nr:thiamine pyrophosphate-binding protein [Beijerinckiaceae bacterium]